MFKGTCIYKQVVKMNPNKIPPPEHLGDILRDAWICPESMSQCLVQEKEYKIIGSTSQLTQESPRGGHWHHEAEV